MDQNGVDGVKEMLHRHQISYAIGEREGLLVILFHLLAKKFDAILRWF